MRIKGHFRNEPSPTFIKIPSFTPKSSWKLPRGHPNLEVFLSQIKHEIFKSFEKPLGYSNGYSKGMSGEQYVRYLMTATLLTDKGSCIVVWDRSD